MSRNEATAAPPRRTQAQRALEMQQRLVDGAIELLKKKRYAGFRIAEVADHAGVSRGAQTHHFPLKDDLVLEALEAVYRRTSAASARRIEAARKDPASLLHALVLDSREFFLGDDFYLSLDLMMVGADSELGVAVKKLARRYRLSVEDAWLKAFVEAGCDKDAAEDVVLLTYSIARGMSIRKLMSGESKRFARLMDIWQSTALGLLDDKSES
jgi:AcrR family transcriptional regulator